MYFQTFLLLSEFKGEGDSIIASKASEKTTIEDQSTRVICNVVRARWEKVVDFIVDILYQYMFNSLECFILSSRYHIQCQSR